MTTTIRGKAATLSRRSFIVSTAAAGGGMALGFHVPFGIDTAAALRNGDIEQDMRRGAIPSMAPLRD